MQRCCRVKRIGQDPGAQKFKLGASVHLSVHKFQAVNLAFHMAVAPRKDDCRCNCCGVTEQPVTKPIYFGQTRCFSFSEPVVQSFALLTTEHVSEALRQGVEYRDFGTCRR